MDAPPPGFAQYPRPGSQGGGGPSPYLRPPGCYFDAIGDAWRLVSEDLGLWAGGAGLSLGMYVLQIALSQAVLFLTMPSHPGLGETIGVQLLSSLAGMVVGIFNAILMSGMMAAAAQKARTGRVTFNDFFSGFRRFGTLFGTQFFFGLALTLGFLCCIVPGIYLVGALTLAQVIAIDQDISSWDAITLSYRTIGPRAWAMFGILFVAGLLQSLGLMLCCVGYLFAMPVYVAVVGLHYFYFFPGVGQAQPSGYGWVPPVQGR